MYQNFMPVTFILMANVSDTNNLRTVLFLLLILAIVLILVGAVIALLTLASYRRAHAANGDQSARD